MQLPAFESFLGKKNRTILKLSSVYMTQETSFRSPKLALHMPTKSISLTLVLNSSSSFMYVACLFAWRLQVSSTGSAKVHAVTVVHAKSCGRHTQTHTLRPFSYTKWHLLKLQRSKSVHKGNDNNAKKTASSKNFQKMRMFGPYYRGK